MTAQLVEIRTTVASEEDAVALARKLVESGHVACATFFPVRSVYSWKGELCDEAEFQVVCKTLESRAGDVESRIAAIHPYGTPAVLRVPVLRANDDYVSWVCARVGPDTRKESGN